MPSGRLSQVAVPPRGLGLQREDLHPQRDSVRARSHTSRVSNFGGSHSHDDAQPTVMIIGERHERAAVYRVDTPTTAHHPLLRITQQPNAAAANPVHGKALSSDLEGPATPRTFRA